MLADHAGGRAGGVVFCADLIPGRPWVHLPVTMGYDRYPELLIDEKQPLLEDKLARGVRLFFTHDVRCALAMPTWMPPEDSPCATRFRPSRGSTEAPNALVGVARSARLGGGVESRRRRAGRHQPHDDALIRGRGRIPGARGQLKRRERIVDRRLRGAE